MHDCQEERGSLTRRQLGGEKRDRSRREVLSSSTQNEGWKDGGNTPTPSYHFRTPILRGRKGGREGDVSPAVFVSGDEISSTGASAASASAVAVGRPATENRSIDRHR